MTVHSNYKKDLAELAQGGVATLQAVEAAWAAVKADDHLGNWIDLDDALKAHHAYLGAGCVELGLKLVTPDTATGEAGEVMLSGGTDKNDPPPHGGG